MDYYDNRLYDDYIHLIKAELFAKNVNEYFFSNEYSAILAGYSASLTVSRGSFSVNVSGYSDKISLMSDKFAKIISGAKLSEKFLEQSVQKIKDAILSRNKSSATSQASDVFSSLHLINYRSSKKIYDPENGIDLLSSITIADLEKFQKSFLIEKGLVEGLIYGNTSRPQAEAILDAFYTKSDFVPEEIEFFDAVNHLKIPRGHRVILHRNATDNNVFIQFEQIAGKSRKEAAMSQVLSHAIGNDFFADLRTEQQLGYSTHATSWTNDDTTYLRTLIQSDSTDPQYAMSAVKKWKRKIAGILANMPNEELKTYRRAISDMLVAKPLSMGDGFGELYTMTISEDGDFKYYQNLALDVLSISLPEFRAFAAKAFDPDQVAGVSILSYGKEAEMTEIHGEEVINDKNAYRSRLSPINR